MISSFDAKPSTIASPLSNVDKASPISQLATTNTSTPLRLSQKLMTRSVANDGNGALVPGGSGVGTNILGVPNSGDDCSWSAELSSSLAAESYSSCSRG